MKPLLFEIGTEEIPARFITMGLEILKEEFEQLFDTLFIEHDTIFGYATPRRLTIYIKNVAETQKDRTVEFLGPPGKIAFDHAGVPTKAASGFAKSLNIDVRELKIKQTDRGEYVSATVEEKGGATKDVLAAALPELVSSLHLPKSMRWGEGSLRFFRPIQWIVALFDHTIIPFELEGIKSGNISYGHRFLSPGGLTIEDPAAYLPLLKQNSVIADPSERKSAILAGIKAIESSTGCRVRRDDELLDTVTNLVEYPSAVLGNFEDKYITLPKELLITVMKTHQKYFSLEDNDGTVLPLFVVVSNTSGDNNDTVRRGAERVLRARLEDARFYYIEDQKVPLSQHREELKKVTFQEKLGSIYQKTERIASLCSFIADELSFQAKETLIRAAMLCKADLVTGAVGEFPELQGYMGMIYALNSGEDRNVASALYEHYLPKFSGDILPSSDVGAIVSLADKLDTITAFFSLGLTPTGSEDPFALRRQAAGIIHILQDKQYPLSLELLIEKSLQNLEVSSETGMSLSGEILRFFYPRLEGIFVSKGYSPDTIHAALPSGELNIHSLNLRVETLSALKEEPGFPGLLTAAKRVYNILANVQYTEVKSALLTETAEKDLLGTVQQVRDKLIESNFRALFELEKPVNTFFDSVLVMDKDPQIRENRLALLFSVKKVFDSLADFSKIVG